MQKNSPKTFSIDKLGIFLILLGSLAWSLTMVKSGLVYDFGIGFWGPNGHDGVWHLSLATSLANGSYEMPIFAGEQIKNYHLGFDIFLTLLNRLTTIPVSTLYFQILPPIFALLIGLLAYTFIYKCKNSKSAALWSTFFVYFAGNLGWIVTFLRTGELGGESMFWAQPAVLTLINPPFAMSLVFILIGLNLLARVDKKISLKLLILVSVIFGLLIQIKAYAGIIVLGALFITGIYEFWRKRSLNYLKIFSTSAFISLLIFFPNLASGSLLEFRPFWFLETMMSFPDRLNWPRFGEAMSNYKTGGNLIKAIPAYIIALLIFWFGNLGTRFVSKFYTLSFLKNKKLPESKDVFLVLSILIGLCASMLFVQKGTAWNTIQFSYYSLFFVSIISGVVFSQILESTKAKPQKLFLVACMIAFTIPTTISVMKHYLPSRPPAKLSLEELSALEFLSKQDKGTVLVMPFDRDSADAAIANPPRPLYLYESTAYVSAFSSQKVWLEDEVNLDITGYDWKSRREMLLNILSSNNPEQFESFLMKEHIKYVYLVDSNLNILNNLVSIYDKSGVQIFYYSAVK